MDLIPADYDRDTGYVNGAVTLKWETTNLPKIDVSSNWMLWTLMKQTCCNRRNYHGEFQRTLVVPEIDA